MVITRSLSLQPSWSGPLHLKSPGLLGPSGLAFACLSDCRPITLPLLSTLDTPAFFLRLSQAKLIYFCLRDLALAVASVWIIRPPDLSTPSGCLGTPTQMPLQV